VLSARSFAAKVASARFSATAASSPTAGLDAALAATSSPLRGSRAAASLPDLPLREIGAAAPAEAADTAAAGIAARAAGDAFVVLISGDGGWAGFDREVGHALGRLGVPVVGIDSLRYFWLPRSPNEVGRDLTRVVETYLAAWGKRRVILAGYSQGADVIPFMAAGLSPELRRKIALVALVGPDPRADFAVDLAGWFAGATPPPERPVLPELARLRGLPLLCVYGAREQHSLCPALEPRRVTLLRLASTGHFYGGHGTEIADSILEVANRSARGGSPVAAPRRAGHGARSANAG
jgi:type IV secretory pathway VirJ component